MLREQKKDLATSAQSLRDIIDANKAKLRRLKGMNITTALKTLTSERISEEQLNKISSKLNEIIERNEKRVARDEFKKLVAKINEFKPFTTNTGIKKSRAGIEGEMFKEDIQAAISVKESNKEAELAAIKNEVDKLEAELESTYESEKDNVQRRIDDLNRKYDLVDRYGGLENASVEEIEKAMDSFKDEAKKYTKAHQEWKNKKKAEQDKINSDLADDIYGSKENEAKAKGREGETADIEKQKNKSRRFSETYEKLFGSISSLMKKIDRSFRSGGKGTGVSERLMNDLRRGDSVYIAESNRMKKRIKDATKKIWGKRSTIKKVYYDLNSKIDISLTFKDSNDKEIVTKKRIRHHTAATMWAAWKYGGSNKTYMEKIGVTEDTFNQLDANLSDNVKKFTTFLIEDYYTDKTARAKISDTYEEFTNSRFPFEENYVPINATSIIDIPSIGFSNLSVFKGFTKRRRFGEFDFFKNDIFTNAINYAENYGKFVGLAKPVSQLYSALNNRKVRNALKFEGLTPTAEAIKDHLEDGYVGKKEVFVANYLRRVFVGSKIRANISLLPKQLTSFIASLEGDYGSPSGIMKEWLNIPTEAESRKRIMQILKSSSQFKYRHISDVESATTSESAFRRKMKNQIHPEMFGNKPGEKTLGTILTLFWNPSEIGDKGGIVLGGIPIISYNYKTEYKRLINDKTNRYSVQEAKEGAADYALSVFEKYMNETQQSVRFTDISGFQKGAWKNATFFLNAPMAYSRKMVEKTRNLRRGYIGEKVKLLKENPGMSNTEASVKAFSGMKAKDFGGLFIYSFGMSFLFHTVQRTGTNIISLYDENKDKAEAFFADNIVPAMINSLKGFFPLGIMAEYTANKLQGKDFGTTQDNVVRTLDDSFVMIDDLTNVIKYLYKKKDAETNAEESEDEKKIKKYIGDAIIDLGAFAGMPTVVAKRFRDALDSGDYDKTSEIIARIYGMRKEDVDIWFRENNEVFNEGKRLPSPNNQSVEKSENKRVPLPKPNR